MRWRNTGLSALSLVALTSCPEEFGKEGRVHRAVHEDVMEFLEKSCSVEEAEKHCSRGRERSEECLRVCGPR
ncbi:hypothetical protein P2318_03895 [Myxococcaceae bacterium GXIMD 01537]